MASLPVAGYMSPRTGESRARKSAVAPSGRQSRSPRGSNNGRQIALSLQSDRNVSAGRAVRDFPTVWDVFPRPNRRPGDALVVNTRSGWCPKLAEPANLWNARVGPADTLPKSGGGRAR